jgi:hypothetical protein
VVEPRRREVLVVVLVVEELAVRQGLFGTAGRVDSGVFAATGAETGNAED